jgi:hypothetical protein
MTRNDAIKEFLFKEVPNIAEIIKAKRSKGSKIDLTELITTLSKPNYNLAKEMTASVSGVNRFTKDVFPNKGNEKLCTYLFNRNEHKYCARCQQVKVASDFSGSYCRNCHDEYYSEYMPKYYLANKARYAMQRAEYNLILRRATPKWANMKAIREIYETCPDGWQVDHYYPLKGKTVCGLHVENNLRHLTAFDNNSKGNRMPEE